MIARIEETSRTLKALAVCTECGQLYGYFYSETDWSSGTEDMLTEMVQVRDREDLEGLTAVAGPAWKGRPFASDFLEQDGKRVFESGIHNGGPSLAGFM